MTRVLKIDNANIDKDLISLAAKIITSGGLIIYPTDTAYGLGANALDPRAVNKVYEVKGRDFSKPTHVVVKDWKMVQALTFPNSYAQILYKKFLPGPLTVILPKREIVPDILTANLPTVGVRLPDSLATKMLSRSIAFPYTTPSANKSGGNTPYSIDEVIKELDVSRVDLILDAGELPKIFPSTIIDLTTNTPKIIRQGPITKSQIEKILQISID